MPEPIDYLSATPEEYAAERERLRRAEASARRRPVYGEATAPAAPTDPDHVDYRTATAEEVAAEQLRIRRAESAGTPDPTDAGPIDYRTADDATVVAALARYRHYPTGDGQLRNHMYQNR